MLGQGEKYPSEVTKSKLGQRTVQIKRLYKAGAAGVKVEIYLTPSHVLY